MFLGFLTDFHEADFPNHDNENLMENQLETKKRVFNVSSPEPYLC